MAQKLSDTVMATPCSKCGIGKRAKNFSHCNPCRVASNKLYRQYNAAQIKAMGDAYRIASRDRLIAKATAWNKAHPDQWHFYQRKSQWKKLGIINERGDCFSHVDYDRHYQIQQGKCLGCGLHQTELKRRLCVDHDHKTGKFRGLLCDRCNSALGQAKDLSSVLRKLADYLDGSK